jgi:anti-sigma B factor antagonist
MPLVLMLRHEGAIAIAGVRGSLTLSPTLRGFKKQIERSFTDATRGLVLDLTEVPEMDSAGIGELVALYSSAKRRGFDVALAGANSRLTGTLRLTRLDAFFRFYEDVDSALAAQ